MTSGVHGKRFYYYSYFFQSLVSGVNPFHFLSDIANDRVRDDIKDALRQLGVEKKLISLIADGRVYEEPPGR